MPVLEVKNLQVCFRTNKGTVRAVNDLSYTLSAGKTLALVGESGSGKSVSAMSVLRLLDDNAYISAGEIYFDDGKTSQELLSLPMEKMYSIRGNRISVIFQEPMTALNPVLSIGKQLAEPFRIHQGLSKKESYIEGKKMLEGVGIANPERIMRGYAHQLSGGMRQRVMIAMALACRPNILIADEPTTALDVTIQAQILRLMKELQRERGTAILFITHDLGVVKKMADDVAVMYCGQVVERVPAPVIFGKPTHMHPYTEGLFASAPSAETAGKSLDSIPGNVPHPLRLPKGCKFAPRCKYKTAKCVEEEPPLFQVEKEQFVRCFYPKTEERRRKNVIADATIHTQS